MCFYQIFWEAKSYIPSICFTTCPITWKECTRPRNTSRWGTCEVLFLGKWFFIFASKIQLRRHKALEHTKFPDAFPSKWQGWRLTVSEENASQIDWRATISDGSKSSMAESPYGSKLVSPMMMTTGAGVSIIFRIRVFYKAWFEGFEFFIRWPYAFFFIKCR